MDQKERTSMDQKERTSMDQKVRTSMDQKERTSMDQKERTDTQSTIMNTRTRWQQPSVRPTTAPRPRRGTRRSRTRTIRTTDTRTNLIITSIGTKSPRRNRKETAHAPTESKITPNATETQNGGEAQDSSTTPPAAERRRRKSMRGKGQAEGGVARSRREAPGPWSPSTEPTLIGSHHPEGSAHQHEECLNLTQLLSDFGLSPDSLISPVQFSYLCPALLYQIDSRVCIRHYHQREVESTALQAPSSVYVWLSGFVSITIISLLSLLGVVLVPILDQGCFKFLLTFLLALAVGTLSGDALLHLLPHAQGQHDHSSPQDEASDLGTKFDGVWKGLTALGGIYLLFIIEHCLGMYKHYKDHQSKEKSDDGGIGRKLSDHKLNRRSDAEWLNLKALPEDADSSAACDVGLSETQLTDVQTSDSTLPPPASPPPPSLPSPKKNGHKSHGHSHRHSHGHGHSHGGNCHSDQDMKDAGIASIAWMVIMGDGMHNFSDGLAIGAAFSANLTGGISTSVAVFCHELPHELGDFAVLIKAGMSVKQAIAYNVLSALMAYVGMVVGTAVGQYTHHLTSWIFAVTAGMFLYVALVDMLPEMLHGDSEDHKRCQVGHFLLQNLGMITGFSLMLLIAIFEDQIVFDFSF
uniref:Zinc transporter ZIP10 n=1 Tax=Knipowitschia caucasica TaxID=637954 RepID=A0AAV2JYC0_KNICA